MRACRAGQDVGTDADTNRIRVGSLRTDGCGLLPYTRPKASSKQHGIPTIRISKPGLLPRTRRGTHQRRRVAPRHERLNLLRATRAGDSRGTRRLAPGDAGHPRGRLAQPPPAPSRGRSGRRAPSRPTPRADRVAVQHGRSSRTRRTGICHSSSSGSRRQERSPDEARSPARANRRSPNTSRAARGDPAGNPPQHEDQTNRQASAKVGPNGVATPPVKATDLFSAAYRPLRRSGDGSIIIGGFGRRAGI